MFLLWHRRIAQHLAAELREFGHGAQGFAAQAVAVHGHQQAVHKGSHIDKCSSHRGFWEVQKQKDWRAPELIVGPILLTPSLGIVALQAVALLVQLETVLVLAFLHPGRVLGAVLLVTLTAIVPSIEVVQHCFGKLVPGFTLDHRHRPGLRVGDGGHAAGPGQDVGDQLLRHHFGHVQSMGAVPRGHEVHQAVRGRRHCSGRRC
mmetsp:Transcript_44566/g.70891  ORF Transcript_44566/g.70891 Transcript_44566/m.70891 type:complete len:204 (+) Transcript_44566:180-791(+)